MSKELRPKWDGFLLCDEKMGRIRGRQQWWYLGVDRSGDIVDCTGVKELTVNEAIRFLEEIKGLGFQWQGIVTDLDTVLTLAVEHVFKGIPHQYCLKHALSAIEGQIGYTVINRRQKWTRGGLRDEFERLRGRKGVWVERSREEFYKRWEQTRALSKRFRQVQSLRDACHGILFAKTEEQAEKRFRALRYTRSYPPREFRKVIAFFKRHWEHLVAYHRVPGLPRTNNLVENVNKQIQRRFKTIESFQHPCTAIQYMNLLIAYLRCKPYTDCRKGRRHLNGKSRLQAAKVRNLSPDWLANCLKTTQNSNR
jgi:transposase-like protein